MNYAQMVFEFMEKHNQHRQSALYLDSDGLMKSTIPDSVKVLRLRLMMEELGELAAAMHANNAVLVADGLADLMYVVVGTAIAYDLPINEIFREVHTSNMTKAPLDKTSKGGKVSKEGYAPPDIKTILELHMNGAISR